MSQKKSNKADLESRKINFFLIGCIVALTLSWLGLDIFATIQAKQKDFRDIAPEQQMEDLQMMNTDEMEKPQEEPEQQKEETKEVAIEMVKNDQKVAFDASIFGAEADEDTEVDDTEGDVEAVEEVIEDEPPVRVPTKRAEFPGGMAELQKFLRENVQYPPEARTAGWQGTVMTEFVVEKDGRISNVKVLMGVTESLDNEAVRVIKSLPKWKPAENNGATCRSYFSIPITFTLQ